MTPAVDTANRFMVGLAGDGIAIRGSAQLIRGLARRPLSKDDALNLAAWLVAMADPTDERFPAILQAVRST